MAFLNKVMLIGNIGKDPEIKTLQNGRKLVSFSLATSKRYRDNKGEQKEETQWQHRYLGQDRRDIREYRDRQGDTALHRGRNHQPELDRPDNGAEEIHHRNQCKLVPDSFVKEYAWKIRQRRKQRERIRRKPADATATGIQCKRRGRATFLILSTAYRIRTDNPRRPGTTAKAAAMHSRRAVPKTATITADGDIREDSQAIPDWSAITRNETRHLEALDSSANIYGDDGHTHH